MDSAKALILRLSKSSKPSVPVPLPVEIGELLEQDMSKLCGGIKDGIRDLSRRVFDVRDSGDS